MGNWMMAAVIAAMLAIPAGAVQLDCTPLGTAIEYVAESGVALARTFSNVAPDSAVGEMRDFNLPTSGGTTPGFASAMVYMRCEVPAGQVAGTGTVTWLHRASSAKLVDGGSRLAVEVVDLAGDLTPAANNIPGAHVGDVPWPTRPAVYTSAAVDLGGATGTVTLRIAGELSVPQRTLIAVIDQLRVDVALSAAAVDSVTDLIDQLAAAMGIDAAVLRVWLTALGGGR